MRLNQYEYSTMGGCINAYKMLLILATPNFTHGP